MTKLPRSGLFGLGKPDLAVGERVQVILGAKEEEHTAKIVALPDGDFVTWRTVKVHVEGEKEPRKISLDRVVAKT